ncbi:MAG: urease accessory protein UreD [Gammaproteobacteria bacterium]
MLAEAALLTRQWPAALALDFAPRHGRTVIARRDLLGPLAVQKALYPEGDLAHVYLLHPPAGLVGGDRLDISLRAASDSHALVTTPASGKVYRSAGAQAAQSVTLAVAAGASLEWLPQDTILFDASRFAARTRVALAGDAAYLGREQVVLGRPAHGDDYATGDADLILEVEVDGAPLLEERLRIAAPSAFMQAPWGLGGRRVIGTLHAWPADDLLVDAARAVAAPAGVVVGTTRIERLLCLRCLGDDATAVRDYLARAWAALRPAVIGRAPSVPRVWRT